MNEAETLDRLAGLAGIRPFYWDVFGGYHEASPEGKKAILAALGYPADTPKQMEKSLAVLEARSWGRWLRFTTVLRKGREFGLRLNLPSTASGRTLHWTIIFEDGSTRTGKIIPAELELTETRKVDGVALERRYLPLPGDLPEGYHMVRIENGEGSGEGHLIVAPARCHLPTWVERDGRKWGLNTHLYSLRTRDDWGIGDFGGLARLAKAGHALGAASVGINPVHAMFPDTPQNASPYSPSSRLFLNPLYIDVTGAPGYGQCEAVRELTTSTDFADRLEGIRAETHVDYPAVTTLKLEVLELLYTWFLEQPAKARASFDAFCEAGGESLRRFCLHEVLREHHKGKCWHQWTKAFRDPASKKVQAFADKNAERLGFFAYLQWLAESQLETAGNQGLSIGLYRDLAVGADAGGADAWAEQDLIVNGVGFGAPPDAFNPLGQNWGLPPLHPHTLRERGYAPFRDMLRANMRHAGALRIDHAMALMQLYWVPGGSDARSGAYVHYPFDDLLGVLALESQRNKCLIIGEDLGTVPDGFRERMEAEGILSYRLFFFERWESGLFMRPENYPRLALATATTHDLPTVAGYWRGTDLELRRSLGLFHSNEAMESDLHARQDERDKLLAALEDQGLKPDGLWPDPHMDEAGLARLTQAAERFVARTPSCLLMVNLDDLLCELDQLNLPGTVFEYPNWRRRLSRTVEDLTQASFTREVLRDVINERRR